MATPPQIVAIEAGGTKFKVALADRDGRLLPPIRRIDTRGPDATLAKVVAWVRAQRSRVKAVGLATFGPVGVDPAARDFGTITTTPKEAWRGCAIVARLREALGADVHFHTDVVAAALAEQAHGAARGRRAVLYVTIGTGIGGGFVVAGIPIHGRAHAELGHVLVPRLPLDRAFRGVCPYHRDCFEGFASGPAIAKRYGAPAETLAPTHAAWRREAEYVARACASFAMALAPDVIVIGGGVGERAGLLPLVRKRFAALLGGYLDGTPAAAARSFLVRAGLAPDSGLRGAALLAARGLHGGILPTPPLSSARARG